MRIYNSLRRIKGSFTKADLFDLRRIKGIKTSEKIAAMTFDDGPCALICPDGRKLTMFICETLASYGFTATFNIIGSTAENYPDKQGRAGGFYWSGIKYDHYPQYGGDALGGAESNGDIIRALIDAKHELANHSYRHIVCGAQGFPYTRRTPWNNADEAADDYARLHHLIYNNFGYKMTGARPPHYVEKIADSGIFDVYDKLGYHYYCASYDAGGWQRGDNGRLMIARMEKRLRTDPNAFCGAIISQKDGLCMDGEMPVYYALEGQLELLVRYGYKVVSVGELLVRGQKSD